MKSHGVWVYVIGILMFIWGFCQLGYALKGFNLPITIPLTEWGIYFGEQELFEDFQWGLGLSCMIAGIGLLVFQAWARILSIWIIWVFMGFSFYIFLLVGPLEFEEFFALKFGIILTMAILLLWFFNQEGTRETLNSDPYKKKKRLIPFTTMLIVVIGIFIFINLPRQLPIFFQDAQFPEVTQVSYPTKSRQYYKARFERTDFPYAFSIAVPKGTTLISLNQRSGFNEAGQCNIQLDTPGHAQSLFLTHETAIQSEWSSDKIQKFFENITPLTPYAYARKIFSDRRSITNWKVRNRIAQWGGDEIHEVNFGGLHNFIIKAKDPGELFGKPIRWYFEFHLFNKEKSNGGGRLFVFERDDRSSMIILGSLQNRWAKSKTALEYFQGGLDFKKKKKYEKAKMAFASAICMEEKNSSYHYALGEMFYKTGKYEQADRHLTRSLQLLEVGQDFPEARKLFEKTRKKIGKSTELNPSNTDSNEKT